MHPEATHLVFLSLHFPHLQNGHSKNSYPGDELKPAALCPRGEDCTHFLQLASAGCPLGYIPAGEAPSSLLLDHPTFTKLPLRLLKRESSPRDLEPNMSQIKTISLIPPSVQTSILDVL